MVKCFSLLFGENPLHLLWGIFVFSDQMKKERADNCKDRWKRKLLMKRRKEMRGVKDSKKQGGNKGGN